MSYSNVTRVTGMYSGLDTQALITNLMNAESMRLNNMKRNAMLVSFRQEAYRSVYSDLRNFQKSFLDLSSSGSMRLQGTFSKQKISVKNPDGTDSNAVTAAAGGAVGSYSVKVSQLAAADLYESASAVGGTIKSEDGFKFDVSNIQEGTSYKVTLDGVTKTISFNSGDVVAGGKLAVKDGKLSINDSGNITELDEQGFIDVFNEKLKTAFGAEGLGGKQKVEAKLTSSGGVSIFTNGYHSGLTIEDGSSLFSSKDAGKGALSDGKATEKKALGFSIKVGSKIENIYVDVKEDMTQGDLVNSLNGKLSEAGLDNSLRFSINSDGNIKIVSYSSISNLEISDAGTNIGSMQYLGFEGMSLDLAPSSPLGALGITSGSSGTLDTESKLSDIFGSELSSSTLFSINGRSFSFSKDTKLSDLMDQVNSSDIGVTLRYDEKNGVFQLEGNDTGYVNKITMSGDFLTNNLGFGTNAKREAADSVVTINGTTLTRATNEYEYEGVEWTFNRTTNDELNVTIASDTESIKEKLKAFVEGYNELVEKLNSQINTSRPRYQGSYYDPLLDEEKSEMSETEISQWEEKAKTGLLYRDGIVTSVAQQMRSALNQAVTLEDGTRISLHSLGITTGDWSKNGQLEIDESKLDKALEKYGDGVMTLFTNTAETGGKGLAERVNDVINSAIGSKGTFVRKAGIEGSSSEYNNELYNQLKDQNDRITAMLTKLAEREDYYYSIFSRMEAAMAQADSQAQYLAAMMGG